MNHCNYCGLSSEVIKLTKDHVIPKKKGGKRLGNIVPACQPCNSIKGDRSIEEARPRLIQRIIKWPKFNVEQIEWLRTRGFDVSEYDNTKLWCEQVN